MAQQQPATTPPPNDGATIDALPLDLFGAPQPAPAPPPAATTSAPPLAAPSPAVPSPADPSPADLSLSPGLARVYDALGVLLVFCVVGALFGAFTWRVVWLLPLSVALYWWPLRRFRPVIRSRLDAWRVALERG